MPVRLSDGSGETKVPPNEDDNGGPATTIRLYIASDVRLFREGLSASLSRQRKFDLVGMGSLPVALQEIGAARPHVLLLDLSADGSLFLPRQARLIVSALRVVAFAVAEVESNVQSCAEAGVSGYVAQDASAEDLASAVILAMRGELVCSPRIAGFLYRRVAENAPPTRLTEKALTRREREITALVSEGLSNKEIARRLRLGNPTVKNHVHNVLQKLEIQRRGQIASLQLGSVSPEQLTKGSTASRS
jgi:two-component system nitrate/nitrite response regulator NarL